MIENLGEIASLLVQDNGEVKIRKESGRKLSMVLPGDGIQPMLCRTVCCLFDQVSFLAGLKELCTEVGIEQGLPAYNTKASPPCTTSVGLFIRLQPTRSRTLEL